MTLERIQRLRRALHCGQSDVSALTDFGHNPAPWYDSVTAGIAARTTGKNDE